MKLSEFINKRLSELGMKRTELVNKFDLQWSTLSDIDKGMTIRKVTQEKLAKALQCSMGDIQACLAEQNPLKDVVVNKKSLAKLKKPEADTVKNIMEEKPYVAPATDPEEPALAFRAEEEPEVDMMFPVETEEEMDNRITREVAEAMYKRKLKEMVLRVMSENRPGEHTMVDMYCDIGMALVKELVGGTE